MERAAARPLETVEQPDRAAVLLHPLRLRILAAAREPCSASAIAAALGLPRQRVHYHVAALREAGLLRAAGRRAKRNMTEHLVVASAHAYLLAPRVLGPLAPRVEALRAARDTHSASYLLALAARLQEELGRAVHEAADRGAALATLSMVSELRFESAEQRARFGAALERAVREVVREHASPAVRDDGSPAPGRPFRLVVGCHPVPPGAEADGFGGLGAPTSPPPKTGE